MGGCYGSTELGIVAPGRSQRKFFVKKLELRLFDQLFGAGGEEVVP
jgi:hypothetical protein